MVGHHQQAQLAAQAAQACRILTESSTADFESSRRTPPAGSGNKRRQNRHAAYPSVAEHLTLGAPISWQGMLCSALVPSARLLDCLGLNIVAVVTLLEGVLRGWGPRGAMGGGRGGG